MAEAQYRPTVAGLVETWRQAAENISAVADHQKRKGVGTVDALLMQAHELTACADELESALATASALPTITLTDEPRNRADLTGRNLAKTRRDIAALAARVKGVVRWQIETDGDFDFIWKRLDVIETRLTRLERKAKR